jgi:hypothetical protein
MGSQSSAIPDPTGSALPDHGTAAVPGAAPLPDGASTPPLEPGAAAGSHPHDFEAQKRIHQQIRNDPDYDDWEYGTEPLPHEAWIAGRRGGASEPAARDTPQPIAEGRSSGG